MIPLSTSVFFSYTDPLVLGIREVKMLKVVDFPAPLGPNNPKISPYFTPKLLFLTAVNPLGYYLVNLHTFTISSHLGSSNLFSSFTTSSSYKKSSSSILDFIFFWFFRLEAFKSLYKTKI